MKSHDNNMQMPLSCFGMTSGMGDFVVSYGLLNESYADR